MGCLRSPRLGAGTSGRPCAVRDAGTRACRHRARIRRLSPVRPLRTARGVRGMMLKEAQSYLLESSNPSVVNIGSIAGVTGIGSSIAYASSKGALLNMTKSLARALGPIRVNAICPGFIQGDWLRNGLGDEVYEMVKEATEKSTPLKLTVTADQVADSIIYFVEDAVTTTGETLLLDGGMHLGGPVPLK